MENFETDNISPEKMPKTGTGKGEIKEVLGNKVNRKTGSIKSQEEMIREYKEKIDELIEKSEKIKKEADKLFDQEKKD